MLNQRQIELIQATVPIIRSHGETVTTTFYHNLLTAHPELNSVFNQSNQSTGHQSRALASAVLAYAQHIDQPSTLSSAIKHISNKHASLFIQPEQYAIVGHQLLNAFAEVLGDAFTPSIREAWAAAYSQLADLMIGTETDIYKQDPSWTDWREFNVTFKTRESSEIVSFTLTPKDGSQPLPVYLPGQYISIKIFIPNLGYTQIRQYSLSDSYDPKHYRISVKRDPGVLLSSSSTDDEDPHPGTVSNTLHTTIQVGDTVHLSRPMGTFHLPTSFLSSSTSTHPASPLVLISAGIGITPLLSILNTVLETTPTPSNQHITWIHGANATSKRPFTAHINDLARQNSDALRVIRFVTNLEEGDELGVDYEVVGRVDLDRLEKEKQGLLFLDDTETRYLICGPDGFMEKMKTQLLERGVPRERVMMEKFGTGGF